MEVPGGVLAGRAVAAPDVPTGETHAEMDPSPAGLEALRATLWGLRLDWAELGDVGTARGHDLLRWYQSFRAPQYINLSGSALPGKSPPVGPDKGLLTDQ